MAEWSKLFRSLLILGVLCGLGIGLAQDDDAVDITPQTQDAMADLSGNIVVSFVGQDTQTWEAMCAAYTELHKNVNCTVELKPNEGYQEFIRTQFAAGTPEFSFVNGNVVADLVNAKQFVCQRAPFHSPLLFAPRPRFLPRPRAQPHPLR